MRYTGYTGFTVTVASNRRDTLDWTVAMSLCCNSMQSPLDICSLKKVIVQGKVHGGSAVVVGPVLLSVLLWVLVPWLLVGASWY